MAKCKQPPKPRVTRLTIGLLDGVVRDLERLLDTQLFGDCIEAVAERVICRWLVDNSDHPFLREARE